MVKKKTPIKKTVKPKPEKRPAIAAKGRVEGELAFDELKTVLLQRFNDFELKLEALSRLLTEVSREVAVLADSATRQPLPVNSAVGKSSSHTASFNRASSSPSRGSAHFGPQPPIKTESSPAPHSFEPRRHRTLYPSVCADCRKNCEVPVKPAEGRPVYCKQCFSMRKAATAHHSPDRRNAVAYIARKSGYREPSVALSPAAAASARAVQPQYGNFQKKGSSSKQAAGAVKKRK